VVKKISFFDIRKQIQVLRNNTSFGWVALRSAYLTKKCVKCGLESSQYSEAGTACRFCLGTGHHYVDKLVRAHKTIAIPGIDLRTEIGVINTKTQYYYFESGSKPKSTDYVLELSTDVATNLPRQPFTIRRVFKITDTQALRGNSGRIEFWRCQVEERNFDLGKPITTLGRVTDVAPTTVGAVTPPTDGEWVLLINDGELELNTDDYSFPITNIDGEDKKLYLDPQQAPPVGQLKIIDINGNETTIELSEG
jgi:hypothetical protein